MFTLHHNKRGGHAVMVDATYSNFGRQYSTFVFGLVLVLAGALVLLLSSQFESATSINAVLPGAGLLFTGFVASIYAARQTFSNADRFEVHAAAILLAVGCLLLFVGTPVRRLMEVETEVLGVLTALAGTVIGIAALRTLRRRGRALASFAEKSLSYRPRLVPRSACSCAWPFRA
jgi:hypothetical protein